MRLKLFKKSSVAFLIVNAIVCVFMLYKTIAGGVEREAILFVIVQILLVALGAFFYYVISNILDECIRVYPESKQIDGVKSILLNKSPIGFIVIDAKGTIEYLNPAVGQILGSTRTIGMNILEFDTVRNSKLFDAIVSAQKGLSVEIRGENYLTYITRQTKNINFFVYPDCNFSANKVTRIIIIVQDITEEKNLTEKLRANYHNTIETLATLVDARDIYTGEHSKNVTVYAMMLCDALNMSEEEIYKIRMAASFHDIGKIGVSDFILNKPEKLTNDEYEKMKRHSNLGANILMKIEGFSEISEIVRHHHERWDGRGYPSGLLGEEIPFGSRIIAVADTYDAMISDRIYRKGLSKETAIGIMLGERGKQLQAELVDLFISQLEKGDKQSEQTS